MDDQPVGAGGSYNYNFDQFDENTNPFASTKTLRSSPILGNCGDRATDQISPERDVDDNSGSKGTHESSPSGGGDLDINENTQKKAASQSRLRKPSPRKPNSARGGSRLAKPVSRRSPDSDQDIDIIAATPQIPSDTETDNNIVANDSSSSSSRSAQNVAGTFQDLKGLSNICDAEDLSPINDVANDVGNGPGSGQSGLTFPEDEFRPATDVFNDTNTWDILETFGRNQKSESSNLARESLYVRFDPLVKKNSPMVPMATNIKEECIPEVDEPAQPDHELNSDSDLLMLNTPPTTKNRPKHPAARQLQKKVVQQASRSDELDKIFEVQARQEPKPGFRSYLCMFGLGPPASESESESEMESEVASDEDGQSDNAEASPEPWQRPYKPFCELEEPASNAGLSQDSLDDFDCPWEKEMDGRPDSPVQFDHEELLRIDERHDCGDSSAAKTFDDLCLQQADLKTSSSGLPSKSGIRMSAVTAPVPNEGGIVELLKYSEADLGKVKMEHQARVLTKERDWEKRETQLMAEIQEHKDTIEKMTQSNEDMQKIVAEYERTVSQVIVDKAKLTSTTEENLGDAIRERNQAVDQLRTMESAFSDLHGRYEKAKVAVGTLKANEEELQKCINEYQNKIKKHEQRYQLLKQHAEEKLQSANEEIDKVHKSKNSEIARIQAALKRSELQVSSLENSLQQKVQENKELTSICDDLIKQVGGDG